MKLAIVDDNKLEQELIFNTLRTYEHERNISLDISSYSDGNSFLNTFVPGDFDLIFMDIYLNELNGIDIVRKIRQMDSKVMIVSTQIFHVLDDALALLPEQEAELSFEYRSFDVHFPLSKIQYIYSNNHEVIIHTTNGTHAFRLPFYSVTDHLDDSRFLQCNRGIMLNMDYIKTMESDYFEMTDSKCFPIKTKGRKQIREQYIKYQFLKLEEA